MSKLLKYKGYYGSIETSMEDMVIHGKIECISDLVTYEANTLQELQSAFEEAVDDYLETCAVVGKSPDKTMSGTFNIRIGEELHKSAYLQAKKEGLTLNDFIKRSVEEKLSTKNEIHIHLDRQNDKEYEPASFDKSSKPADNWALGSGKRTRH